MSATVDLNQLATLRRLRAAFGDVQVLEVLDQPGRDPSPVSEYMTGATIDMNSGRFLR